MQHSAVVLVRPDKMLMPCCRVAGSIPRRRREDRKLGPWSGRLIIEIEGHIRDWPGAGGGDVRCPRDVAQGVDIGTRDDE